MTLEEQITGRPLVSLQSLERAVVGNPRTDKNGQSGENLADSLAEVVFDVGPSLRVFCLEGLRLPSWKPPPEPETDAQKCPCHRYSH